MLFSRIVLISAFNQEQHPKPGLEGFQKTSMGTLLGCLGTLQTRCLLTQGFLFLQSRQVPQGLQIVPMQKVPDYGFLRPWQILLPEEVQQLHEIQAEIGIATCERPGASSVT